MGYILQIAFAFVRGASVLNPSNFSNVNNTGNFNGNGNNAANTNGVCPRST